MGRISCIVTLHQFGKPCKGQTLHSYSQVTKKIKFSEYDPKVLFLTYICGYGTGLGLGRGTVIEWWLLYKITILVKALLRHP
jgi:hypothetical protein